MFKEVFNTTISQMIVLFIFIIIGYLLRKLNVIKQDSIKTLSKLVSTVFLPFVLVSSFMTSFTIDNLKASGTVLLFSLIVTILTIVIGLVFGKLLIKNDEFLLKMYQYGFIYSNFTYMGIPIVEAINPTYKIYYLIFTIIPQFAFTLWALPNLLIPKEKQQSINGNIFIVYLKRLLNPIFVGLILGVLLGLTGGGAWINENAKFISSAISTGGACMSPIAMILTGVVIASYDIVKCLKDYRIYVISFARLIIIPAIIILIYFGVINLFNLSDLITSDFPYIPVCIIAYTAMPLGLNTVIIPSSFDKDVIDCAGMALVSHLLGIITIPIVFAIILA